MIHSHLDLPPLFSGGVQLQTDPRAFGVLRDSSVAIDSIEELRARMASDGYLYLPGYLNREEVLDARREITRRLAEQGCLDPAFEPMEAVAAKDYIDKFKPDVARKNAALEKVLYAGPMMHFFERFFGGPVRHFDYTWLRAISPGVGTRSHCDSVYMNRGTQKLYTAWTPLGDVSFEMGGLMVLEG